MNRFGWLLAALFTTLIVGFALLVKPGEAPQIVATTAMDAPVTALAAPLPVPVAGVPRSSLVDTWGQSRAGGARAHDAIDIAAPVGTPVIAVVDGVIEKLFQSKDGGNTLYLRSADRKTIYYYAHLSSYAPGITEGMQARGGQLIAAVGATGNADPTAPHLHFAIMTMKPRDHWYEGRATNPYPLLTSRTRE